MKISVDTGSFNEVLSHISRIAVPRTSMPVLEGILIEAENDSISLTANNTELAITKTIPARVYEGGTAVISSKIITDIARKCDSEFIEFTSDSRFMCRIESGRAKFEIMGMDPEEYPLPENGGKEDRKIELPAETLKNMIGKTIFSAAGDDTQRPILKGLLFEIEPAYLTIVAVDGYRVAVRKEKVESGISEKVVIPGKLLNEITKIINPDCDKVQISVAANNIEVEVDGYNIFSRLLDGEFLDYKNSIPKETGTTAMIRPKEIVSIIDRISLLISEQVKTPVRCVFKKDGVVFSCSSALGKATDTCEIELEGEELEIGFNSRYLIEALRAIDDDEAVFKMNGMYSPLVITPAEGDNYIYMIMPMRINTNYGK